MLRFFSQGIVTGEIIKFRAFNSVLSAVYYNPQAFNSHLLIALHETGTLKKLSFSFCKQEQGGSDTDIDESMFSLYIDQTSRKVDITLSSGAMYYTVSTKIAEALLDDINQKVWQFYKHPKCQTDSKIHPSPKQLLREFATCVTINDNLISTAGGTLDSIHEVAPKFIELLTSKINEELERLDDDSVPVLVKKQ